MKQVNKGDLSRRMLKRWLYFISLLGVLGILLFMQKVNTIAAPPAPTKPPQLIIPTPLPEVSIQSSSAVYVDESAENTNFNIYGEQYLLVGRDEFTYKKCSLIRFESVTQSQGGLLPDDVVVDRAEIMLYKQTAKSGTIRVTNLINAFDEKKSHGVQNLRIMPRLPPKACLPNRGGVRFPFPPTWSRNG